jgi:hypothetical protein
MEDGHRMDAGRDDVVVAAGNGAEVEVADRASCVAAELQVDQALWVGTRTVSARIVVNTRGVIVSPGDR